MRRHFSVSLSLLLMLFLLAIGLPAHAGLTQTITFGAQGGQTFGAAPFALNPVASSDSGLAVSYTSTTLSVCTISGTTVTILTAGTCTIAADQAGDATYDAATQVTQDIVIAKASQTITFGAQSGQTFGAAPFALNPLATAGSALAITYTSTTPAVCTITGSTVTIVTAGTCTIAADQAGNINFNAAPQVTQNIVIAKASQTITFGAQAAQSFISAPFAISPAATASSGLAITYTSTTLSVCTVSGSTVTVVAVGTCTIAANQAGNTNFNAAVQVTQNITIGLGAQTITFGAQAGKAFGAAPFALSPTATASSGLAVSYSSTTPAVCTIAGTTVTIVAVGTCTIAADQAGNGSFSAAPQVTQNIVIAAASQTITFGAQTGKTFGAAPFALSPLATASSGLAVSYSSTTPTICTISGTTVTIVAAGTCTIAADQAGNATYSAAPQVTQSITIAKGNQTITFGAQTGQNLGATPFTISPLATASSGLPVVYSSITVAVCTVSGTTVTLLTAGTCTIAANQAGDTNYNAAPQVTQSVTIAKGSQTITFGAQASKLFGSAPFPLNPTATASSGLAVAYTSTTPTICTISGITVTIVAIGTCTIAANQIGDINYNAAPQVSQNIIISNGSQTITFGAQAGKTFGTAPFPLSPAATASSSLPVSYSSLTPTVCTITGSTVTIVAAGTCTIAANQAGNANYTAAPQVTQNITISTASQTITFGAQTGKIFGASPFPLSPAATASSGLAVTYTSTTTSVCTISGSTVTIVTAGTCTIAANQAGNANYGAAPQVTQNIAIAKASQTITFGAQVGQVIGTGAFELNPVATASSGLPVAYSSTTLTVCTISGTTITMVAIGTCTIAANQAGNANFNAANQVTQAINIGKPTVPSAPTITGITAGFGSAGISFTPPVLNGGALVTGYTATCTASGQITRTATGGATSSLITVLGLTVNVPYSCTLTASNSVGTGHASAPFPVIPAAVYVIPTTTSPLTGLWWNENESGWGLNITQHGAMIFVAWFTYDQSGAATWYVMSSCPVLGNACAGDIYSVRGGKPLTSPWDGSAKVVSKVGNGILSFSNANTGSFSFSINGVTGSKSIVRQMFASGTTTPSPDYSDLWWNASESGWGITISQQYGTIFALMFGYDSVGNSTWYFASNCKVAGNGCSGDLYQVTGGVRPTATWSGAGLAVTKVGIIEFTFTDANNGTTNYFINGAAGSKQITRELF